MVFGSCWHGCCYQMLNHSVSLSWEALELLGVLHGDGMLGVIVLRREVVRWVARCSHLHVVLVLQVLILDLLEGILQTLKVERMLMEVVIDTSLRLITHLSTTLVRRNFGTLCYHYFRLHLYPMGLGRFCNGVRFSGTLLGCLDLDDLRDKLNWRTNCLVTWHTHSPHCHLLMVCRLTCRLLLVVICCCHTTVRVVMLALGLGARTNLEDLIR